MINYLAVFAAAIAAFAIGALWYGPLFGERWRLLMNFSEGHAGPGEGVRGADMTTAMIGGFISTFILVYVLAVLMQALGIQTPGQAVSYGLTIAVGFVATALANSIWYERRPLMLYLINAGHYIVAIVVAALVLFYIG